MSNETLRTTFPATQQDISNLKQTATDAVNDLSSTAVTHASKAKGQLKELAGHVQEEGGEHLKQVQGSLADVLESAREYASERPFVCIGVAFVLGLLFGVSRRGSRSVD
jgi:ElaB/YqjD/DUF883 family membrane-anchored ribosome-binding protein